ncbi:hypothetical protein LLP99_19115, partial [Rouxiella badensis]|uniref:hypothetical protein n=1 Tax=Rouxiella badensis TaxID=1646377 RepID=UPI001D1546F8
WKPPARSPEESMVWQKCSGIRRSYLVCLGNGILHQLIKKHFKCGKSDEMIVGLASSMLHLIENNVYFK